MWATETGHCQLTQTCNWICLLDARFNHAHTCYGLSGDPPGGLLGCLPAVMAVSQGSKCLPSCCVAGNPKFEWKQISRRNGPVIESVIVSRTCITCFLYLSYLISIIFFIFSQSSHKYAANGIWQICIYAISILFVVVYHTRPPVRQLWRSSDGCCAAEPQLAPTPSLAGLRPRCVVPGRPGSGSRILIL